MTRPGKTSRQQTLAELCAEDPKAAVIRVLREAGTALNAGAVQQALQSGGVTNAQSVWTAVQKKLKADAHVLVEPGHRYRWTAQPHEVPARKSPRDPVAEMSAVEALDLIVKGGLREPKRQELAAVIRERLDGPAVDLESAARQRQAEIDAVRALAELAIEVEELAVNESSAAVMIHRVRARVHRAGLEAIDRAGEETTFDRKRHKPIGGSIGDGSPVLVVRPGYVWRASAEDVLIAKAVVEE